jgi:nitroreductase
MSSSVHGAAMREVLELAARKAAFAPSVHNTQPWRFRLADNRLELLADQTRQLSALDPTYRQMLISCGCALLNARVAVASAGCRAEVQRLPEPAEAGLLARLIIEPGGASSPIAALHAAIERRQTNRRRFGTDPVPAELIDELVAAAEAEGAGLFEIVRPEHRVVTAVLSQQADAEQNADPAYRAELRAWTTDDPNRRDGVPASAVPPAEGGGGDDIPIRDFDSRGSGWLPTDTRSSIKQCLLLLTTTDDSPLGWLQAGEALERIWLTATDRGYALSLLTQVVEVPRTREQLRTELGLTSHPLVLLRIGKAPITPGAPRRPLTELIEVD